MTTLGGNPHKWLEVAYSNLGEHGKAEYHAKKASQWKGMAYKLDFAKVDCY